MKLFYMFSGESMRNCLQQTHGCSSFFQIHSISFFSSCIFFHLFFFLMHISLSSFPFLFNISSFTSFHSFLNSLHVKFFFCFLFIFSIQFHSFLPTYSFFLIDTSLSSFPFLLNISSFISFHSFLNSLYVKFFPLHFIFPFTFFPNHSFLSC